GTAEADWLIRRCRRMTWPVVTVGVVRGVAAPSAGSVPSTSPRRPRLGGAAGATTTARAAKGGSWLCQEEADGSPTRRWQVDRAPHVVYKCTLEGKPLQTIGTRGVAGEQTPFNRPTDVSVAPNGDVYVSDGYGNARVHRFAADGALIQSWGVPGQQPGEF